MSLAGRLTARRFSTNHYNPPIWAGRLRDRTLIVLRHGNTKKAAVDADRELTSFGKEQGAAFAEQSHHVLAGVTNVVASPASFRDLARLLPPAPPPPFPPAPPPP